MLNEQLEQAIFKYETFIPADLHFELRSIAAKIEELQEQVENHPEVKISDGDVWLIFPNAMISIDGICKFGAPGPIVKKNLRTWRDKALEAGGK